MPTLTPQQLSDFVSLSVSQGKSKYQALQYLKDKGYDVPSDTGSNTAPKPTTAYGQFRSSGGSFADKHPIINAIGQGLAEPFRQPVQAAQEMGAGIGQAASDLVSKFAPGVTQFIQAAGKSLGITPQDAESFRTGLMSDSYITPGNTPLEAVNPLKQPEKFIGEGIRAASNLATGVVAGVGTPLALGVQGAIHGLGTSMNEEKTPLNVALDTAVSGILSYGIAKATDVAGKVLKDKLYPTVVNGIKNLFSKTSGIAENDVSWATSNPDVANNVLSKMKVLSEATDEGSKTRVMDDMKNSLLKVGRSTIDDAKKVAEEQYSASMSPLVEKFSSPITSANEIKTTWDTVIEDMGGKASKGSYSLLGGADEDKLVNTALSTLKENKDWSLGGLTSLKRKLNLTLEATDEGTPAYNILSRFYKGIDEVMNASTDGETSTINAAYSEFKDAQGQLFNLWSKRVKDDTALNTVTALQNSGKTGSRQAMQYMEELAGTPGRFLDQLRGLRIAENFARNTPLPGTSRMMDDLIRQVVVGTPAALGGGIGNFIGGGIGAMIGAGVGAGTGVAASAVMSKAIEPKLIGGFLLETAAQLEPSMAGPIRQSMGRLLDNPIFQAALVKAAEGLLGSSASKNQMDAGGK